MKKDKPYQMPKRLIFEAWHCVKRAGGSGGVDGQSLEMFESNLSDNLYKLWNRMSSGSYLPNPVKQVAIAKPSGGERSKRPN